MWLQNWSVTWLFWDPFMMSKHPAKFGFHRSFESGEIPFLFVTWPLGWYVTWLCGWGRLILGHHTAKFGIRKSCESGDIPVFNCHVTTISKCHVTFWVGPLIQSDCPAKLRVHRLYGTGDNGVCNVSSNSSSISNSNSNGGIPVPRFTNGPFSVNTAYETKNVLIFKVNKKYKSKVNLRMNYVKQVNKRNCYCYSMKDSIAAFPNLACANLRSYLYLLTLIYNVCH